MITHGFSCDTEYKTGDAPNVLVPKVLAGGFIVMSHALDHAGHNCNLLTQAESLVMTKEHAIDHYGTLRWTIGSGCSGGSLVQQQVANAYPGVYQGITPQCSFTDAWSSAMQYEEYYFGLQFLEDPSRWGLGVRLRPGRRRRRSSTTRTSRNPITFTTVIPNSGDPSRSCPGVPREKVYDAKTNPNGVRCTLQDYMVNAFGRDEHGFARRGFDNVGIQYGLKGLRDGLISPAQFVDLNTNIGGADIDLNIMPERTRGRPDRAASALYRTGAINSANNLDKVAIIDLRGPDPGAFHDVYRTYAMRARLHAQLRHRRQPGPVARPGAADRRPVATPTRRSSRWTAGSPASHADHREVPLARKIIQDKPDTVAPPLHRRRRQRPAVRGRATRPSPPTARRASAPTGRMTDDVMKCQLKPLRRDDYPVTFTDDQWQRLQKAFPGGVCDYSEAGRRASTAPCPGSPTRTRSGQRDLRRQAPGPRAALAPDPLISCRAAARPPRPARPPPARAAGPAAGAGRRRSAGSRGRAGGRRSATRPARRSSGG